MTPPPAPLGRPGGAKRAGGSGDHGPGTADPLRAALVLITGDPFLMRRTAHRLRDQLAAAQPEAEVHSLDGGAEGFGADLQAALSPSLFASESIVVIARLEEALDPAINTLADLLADPGGSRVVAMHSATKNKKSLSLLSGLAVAGGVAHVEARAPKRGRETQAFLQSLARESGRTITFDAAEALAAALGSELALLVAAIEQLVWDFPEGPITAAEVATMFTGIAEVTGFGLADAVWGREPDEALLQLAWGERSGSLSLPAATGALASGLRGLVRVGSAPRGMSEADVARVAGVPPFKVRLLREQVRKWGDRELAAAAVSLARADAAVKGGLQVGENLDPVQKQHALAGWVRATAGD